MWECPKTFPSAWNLQFVQHTKLLYFALIYNKTKTSEKQQILTYQTSETESVLTFLLHKSLKLFNNELILLHMRDLSIMTIIISCRPTGCSSRTVLCHLKCSSFYWDGPWCFTFSWEWFEIDQSIRRLCLLCCIKSWGVIFHAYCSLRKASSASSLMLEGRNVICVCESFVYSALLVDAGLLAQVKRQSMPLM